MLHYARWLKPHPVLLLRWWRLGDQGHCLAFPTVVTLLYFSTSLGPGTNFAYLAESDLQLAFDEYNWRQSSVPVNPHTPLRTIQQAQDANATARALYNFKARAAMARRMDHERSPEDKVTRWVSIRGHQTNQARSSLCGALFGRCFESVMSRVSVAS
ncbi:hypothetical protein WJX82_011138 [Trebouxia sp. C0006]